MILFEMMQATKNKQVEGNLRKAMVLLELQYYLLKWAASCLGDTKMLNCNYGKMGMIPFYTLEEEKVRER